MTTITSDTRPEPDSVSTWLTFLLALSCGLVVANIYYAQPLAGPIATELGLQPEHAGLLVTMTQLGYGAGLLLIVPLGDLIENRRLVTTTIAVAAVALAAAALSRHPLQFFAAALSVGFSSVAVQILIPYAGHLAPERIRGQVVGNVTSGLMIGVMLSRPASSFIASASSWHVVYWMSSALMALLVIKPMRRTFINGNEAAAATETAPGAKTA